VSFIYLRIQVHDCVVDAARAGAYAQNEPGAAASDVDEFAARVSLVT